jgi:O-antigen ligase
MWPALFLGGFVAFALLVSKALSRRGRVVGAGVLAALLLIAPSILLVKNVPVADRGINAAATVLTRIENDPRVAIWAYAGGRIAERPLTGYGFGRGILRRDFREHFGNPLHWHGHNMFVNHALEGGVGLAAALALVGIAFVVAFAGLRSSTSRPIQLAGVLGIALITVCLVKIMTDDVLVRETSLLLWAALGATLSCARHRQVTVRQA